MELISCEFFEKLQHTGQKPYACKFCDRRFSDFGSRVKHERYSNQFAIYQRFHLSFIFQILKYHLEFIPENDRMHAKHVEKHLPILMYFQATILSTLAKRNISKFTS